METHIFYEKFQSYSIIFFVIGKRTLFARPFCSTIKYRVLFLWYREIDYIVGILNH